jgi:hypothetical protein
VDVIYSQVIKHMTESFAQLFEESLKEIEKFTTIVKEAGL